MCAGSRRCMGSADSPVELLVLVRMQAERCCVNRVWLCKKCVCKRIMLRRQAPQVHQ
jgi:hypothetical protein